MPLTKRLVEPVHVSRERIPAGVKDELEFVTNNTLANVILQLSNLSKHAEDVFAEVFAEANGMMQRHMVLHNRIHRLSAKVTQLDSSVEEVALADINMRKQFRSSNLCDQQVVSRDTVSNAMRDLYDSCDSPPPLNKLNPYRTDGKEGLKFYTDPDYFFELWKAEMLTVNDRQRPEKSRKPGRTRAPSEHKVAKTLRQPHNHLDAMRVKTMQQEMGQYQTSPVPPGAGQMAAKSSYPFQLDQYGAGHGVHPAANYDAGKYGTIRSQSRPGRLDLPPSYSSLDSDAMEETVHMVDYRAPERTSQMTAGVYSPPPPAGESGARQNTRGTPTRPSQPPPAPPSTGSGSLSTRSTPSSSRETFPPPPPEMQGRHSPTPPPHQDFPPPPHTETAHGAAPVRLQAAPPPPPPPPSMQLPSTSYSTTDSQQRSKVPFEAGHLQAAQASLKAPAPVQVVNTMIDARSDLLAAIRGGIHLRKVEQQNQQQSAKIEEKKSSLHNVAEIIARRKAMQHSDSETSSETEEDSEWEETR